ncbi:Tat (twin-arginine translocation) pathway signal sequence [Selenomonas ruminantium]|uniref:Tat (Twin-arginine translocation) pathway signal sequence n=1 Tax=Selenomonas ruminantium TaxID=971 RepID=A0A1I3C314_SELRU|nr:FAD-dependent oxidoreductase [Selenomonas ruminantium]SFH68840.1 Tat (twin-arginine translocation) pathway signal sequence [Selenomonas ruminantium]
MEKSFSIPISRRAFMKLVGMGTVGVLTGAAVHSSKAAAAPIGASGKGLPPLLSADVCVVGGGAAGTAAAVSAARKGAKVVLIERGISLGGLATQGCVFPCMPTFAEGSDTPYITDLNNRMEKQGVSPFQDVTDSDTFYGGGRARYVPEYLSLVYEEMCAEQGVDILYNAALVGAQTDGGRITACIVQTVAGLGKVEAKVFIDGTGDALLSRFVGIPVEKGSEKTGRNQPMSLRFEMGGIDMAKVYHFFRDELKDGWKTPLSDRLIIDALKDGRTPFVEFDKMKTTAKFFQGGVSRGELTKDDVVYIQAFSIPGKPDVMSMNCPEMPALEFSSTDAVSYSKAVSFGRKMMRRLAAFFIKNIKGFEHAYICREASMVGVRESWRIRGKYYMEAEDYLKAHHFADAVCRTAYPIDIHDVKLDLFKKLKKGDYYEIPYRALVTNEMSNLLVVGRCASGSFAAQASFRIQPTCMSMGEAAGIAAAWGLSQNVAINEIKWEEIPESMRSYVSK